MTLIDYFNEFQEVSNAKHFSANARSLYYAILSEFNRLRYPFELKLRNTYLQDMSGINSTASFDSARNALLNAKLITHKKQVYRLVDSSQKPAEKVLKQERKNAERVLKESEGLLPIPNLTLTEKEKDEDAREASTSTKKDKGQLNLSKCSAAVIQTWRDYVDRPLPPGMEMELVQYENALDTEKVVDTIKKAARSNKWDGVSFSYLKKSLDNLINKKNEQEAMTNDDEDWSARANSYFG